MDLEKILTQVLKEKLSCEFRGSSYKRSEKFRKGLKDLYEKSDLTAGEICDFLEIRMDDFTALVSREEKRKVDDVWSQNFDHQLPLFVPVRLIGI